MYSTGRRNASIDSIASRRGTHDPTLLNQGLLPADAQPLARRYFHGRGMFGRTGFSAMKETQPDELFTAWLGLPDVQRNTMDAELRDIFEMSCEKGFCAIRDEAQWHLEKENRRRTGSLLKSSVVGQFEYPQSRFSIRPMAS